ncbi:MAG: GIY-YIG nuclease family protein [Chloroflexi bacterium]|nr:GIY-YIG nuclease family protein [Chloroflexota bacterium]
MRNYYVYIMTNPPHTTLYVGMTNDLKRRISEHKGKLIKGYTNAYNATYLVHYEIAEDAATAIAREKQIKRWLRAKKIALIESNNPEWKDLSVEWLDDEG